MVQAILLWNWGFYCVHSLSDRKGKIRATPEKKKKKETSVTLVKKKKLQVDEYYHIN